MTKIAQLPAPSWNRFWKHSMDLERKVELVRRRETFRRVHPFPNFWGLVDGLSWPWQLFLPSPLFLVLQQRDQCTIVRPPWSIAEWIPLLLLMLSNLSREKRRDEIVCPSVRPPLSCCLVLPFRILLRALFTRPASFSHRFIIFVIRSTLALLQLGVVLIV